MSKMSLAVKVMGGFGLVLVALATVVVAGVVGLKSANEAIEDVAKTHVTLIETIGAISDGATRQDAVPAQASTAIGTEQARQKPESITCCQFRSCMAARCGARCERIQLSQSALSGSVVPLKD